MRSGEVLGLDIAPNNGFFRVRTFYDYSWLARPLIDSLMASLSSTMARQTSMSHMKLMEALHAVGVTARPRYSSK
jgi:hypothetical protein